MFICPTLCASCSWTTVSFSL